MMTEPASNAPSNEEEAMQRMLQLKAVYGLTTGITRQCFQRCVPEINRKLEDDQRYCLVNCAVNYLTAKMLITKKLLQEQPNLQ